MAGILDDPQTRLAAESDPAGFLDFDGLMLIDEVQRVPALWLAIKNSVDHLTGRSDGTGVRRRPRLFS